MHVSAIIVAGGKGERMGESTAKQFLKINNMPIIAHSIKKFEKCSLVDEIILVVHENYLDYCKKDIIEKYKFKKVCSVIKGGKSRQDSVFEGIKALEVKDIVLVHDAVRPFVSDEIIKRVVNGVLENAACVPITEVKDTIKILGEDGFIRKTLERTSLCAVQTPEGFYYNVLQKAYDVARETNFEGTDESSLTENIGVFPKTVLGGFYNIKITTKEDLLLSHEFLDNFL